ncbi:hypothetical protein [Streptomyces oceani]|uniref:hypothetical protein n=1 Tax=Streptomyces oceani TaxID=1075402 RepID=UPI0008733964|nr:hypothetical protein [Streptomyces oceani]
MSKVKKSVALAGVLGGLALSGLGVAQAEEKGSPGSCQWDGQTVRCSEHEERRYTTEDGKKVVIQQTRECSTSTKDESAAPRDEKQAKQAQKESMDCANTVSR